MTCSNCGTENPPGSKFCAECGSPLARACPTCGSPSPAGAKFCNECGTSLVGTATPTARPVQPPATERRLVSVLFADLVGFTTLSESRDSEDVRDLLSGYFDTARTVISRYGGTVEKFIGDAVMAVWGTPVANEDDAERAVRAALDLVAAVAELGAEVGAPDLRARAGVLTGEATVNLGAQGEGMVAGDLVNTASRIQSAAEPGAVFVGEATRRASEAAVAYQDRGLHELKGKAGPFHLWQAKRVTAGRGGLMRSEGLETPFVGRDRELKLVKDLLHACVDEGRATLVQVTGIAGIGKSRLGWEVFKYTDGLQETFLWHRGRCLAYGEGVTYWALAEMVRGRAGIVEGEDRTTAALKLHEAVETYIADPGDRAFVEPRLAHLLGLAERTVTEKHDLFAGWRLFFERLAQRNPVLMVFEDLQWADPSLVEFLDYLLEWSRSFPLFLITLARPAEGASLSTKRNTVSISLEPLSAPAMEQLLIGLVPGLPGELMQRILDRAEGVPLYAVETVRMLLDRELLVEDGSVYRVTGPIEDLEVPETLHALIAARLDGLSPEERRLVQDASVLGKTFTRSAVAALSGMGDEEVGQHLTALVEKEVLGVQADPRSPERGQYGFLQDLVRTVAYEGISKRDRKQKHLQVADYLEGAWGEEETEIVEVVASHLVEAHRLAPDAPDAGGIADRARRMSIRAAERSASLAAAAEAQAYFEQAAGLSRSDLERAELLERAGQMATIQGHGEEAATAYQQAMALFEGAGQPHQAARLEARLAEVEFIEGRSLQAAQRMAKAYAVLSEEEADPDLALVAGQYGRFLALSGQKEEARRVLEDALELAEQLELPEVYSNALSSKAILLQEGGRSDEAATLLRRALDVALEHGFPGAALRAQRNLLNVLYSRDRFVESMELSEAGRDEARRMGNRVQEAGWLGGTATLLVGLARWDEALALVEELAGFEELASAQWAASAFLAAIPVYLGRGLLAEARVLLDRFADQATSENVEVRIYYQWLRGLLLQQEGKLEEAAAEAEAVLAVRDRLGITHTGVKVGLVLASEIALDLADADRAEELLGIVRDARPGQVTPWLRAHAARLAARLAALRGETEGVDEGFLAAEHGLRELGQRFELAVALFEHGQWLAGQNRSEDAMPSLAEAREIFEGLEAAPWLERLEQVRGRIVRPAVAQTLP